MASETAVPAEGSAADLNQIAETLAAITKRLDGQSALIERMRKHAEPEKTGDSSKQPEGLEARIKALETRDSELHVREQKLTRRQICVAVASKLREKGISAQLGDDLAEVLVSRSPDKFGVDDAGSVTVTEGDAALSLDSWASVFLSSDHGRAYLPAKANPRLGIPSQITPGKPGKVITAEDIATGNYDPNLKPSEVVFRES